MSVWTNPENGHSMFRCRYCKQNNTEEIGNGVKRVVVLVRDYHENAPGSMAMLIPSEIMLSDPTLPRIHTNCVIDTECNSKVTVYTKTDKEQMQFQYTCLNGHTWTSNDLTKLQQAGTKQVE